MTHAPGYEEDSSSEILEIKPRKKQSFLGKETLKTEFK